MLWLSHAPQDSRDPLAMASFPLVPYANWIAQGRFRFDGCDYQVPLNFGDHPHSIHGLGWQTPWAVDAQTDDSAHMAHDWPGGEGWPWAYRAEQQVFVQPDGIRMQLSLHNRGDADSLCRDQPVAFHPGHAARPSRGRRCAGDWSQGAAAMGDTLVDNAYGGWNGVAMILRGDGTRLTLTAPDTGWLHVYRPPGSALFCLEPVSHMPDAINRPGGLSALAPGETKTLSMTIALAK
ncbi:MAG: aldose 1-epimerase [bacterium]|nr:aldose 1-epimerase [bacterium]